MKEEVVYTKVEEQIETLFGGSVLKSSVGDSSELTGQRILFERNRLCNYKDLFDQDIFIFYDESNEALEETGFLCLDINDQESKTILFENMGTELSSQLSRILREIFPVESENLEDIEVEVTGDSLTSELRIEVTQLFSKRIEGGVSEIAVTYYDKIIQVDQELELFNALVLSLPFVKEDLPQCSGQVEDCVATALLTLLQNTYPEFKDHFTLEVQAEEQADKESYRAFKIILREAGSPKVFYEFLIIVEDVQRALALQEFSLEQLDQTSHPTLQVKVNEEEFSEEIEYVVVFYGFENVLLSSSSHREAFLNLLSEKINPSSSISKGISFGETQFYYTDEEETEITINYVVVEKEYVNSIFINQYADINDNLNYKLFKENDEVFVSVFAVDGAFSYVVDEERLVSKSLVLDNPYSPQLFGTEGNGVLTLEGEIEGFDRAFTFSISEYAISASGDFDLYLTQDAQFPLDNQCIGASFVCYHLSRPLILEGTSYMVMQPEENNGAAEQAGHISINSDEFQPSAQEIEEGTYDLYIVPVDADNVGGIREDYTIKYEYTQTQGENGFTYYQVQDYTPSLRKRLQAFSVTLSDLSS